MCRTIRKAVTIIASGWNSLDERDHPDPATASGQWRRLRRRDANDGTRQPGRTHRTRSDGCEGGPPNAARDGSLYASSLREIGALVSLPRPCPSR